MDNFRKTNKKKKKRNLIPIYEETKKRLEAFKFVRNFKSLSETIQYAVEYAFERHEGAQKVFEMREQREKYA